MSQQLKYDGGLQIDLLGTPPSDKAITEARQRAAAHAEGEARDERTCAVCLDHAPARRHRES